MWPKTLRQHSSPRPLYLRRDLIPDYRSDFTLDAHGDANAIWIFQMPSSTLTLTTPACNVILANGAQFSNIFWQVGSSATIGTNCVLEGSILADTSITLVSGATVHGRAMEDTPVAQ